jgi:hypothetical protein
MTGAAREHATMLMYRFVVKDRAVSSSTHEIASTVVIRDSGGLDNVGYIGLLHIESGTADDRTSDMFGDYIDHSLRFTTQGSAHGYWNYASFEAEECYGEWSFTKDWPQPNCFMIVAGTYPPINIDFGKDEARHDPAMRIS